MTRQDIINRAKEMVGEYDLGLGGGSPFLWNNFVDTAADEIAKATDCFYVTYTADLVANLATYCAPNIYKLKGVAVADANGNFQELFPQTVEWLHDLYRSIRLDTSYVTSSAGVNQTEEQYLDSFLGTGGIPVDYVSLGVNTIQLVPIPAYATTGGGLSMEGYGLTRGLWPNPTDVCPLPLEAQDALIFRAASLRCVQYPTPENQTRRVALLQDFTVAKHQLEGSVLQYTEATRARGKRSGLGYSWAHRW